MANKEATIYVIDVNQSMGKCHQGRNESDLEWSMKYVWDRLAGLVGTGLKTKAAGVLAFGTDETDHDFASTDEYTNISVLQSLGQILMPELRSLSSAIKPSQTNDADPISALVVAIEMMSRFTRKLKYTRRMVMVTSARQHMDADGVNDIAEKLKMDGIELIILGVDFDNAEFGFKEEDKGSLKADNENVLQTLAQDAGGVCGTMAQAIADMEVPKVRQYNPTPGYRGILTLGNPERYDTAITLDVERYPRIMVAKAPSASNFAIRNSLAPVEATQDNGAGQEQGADDLSSVKNARTYQVNDENAPGGKMDVAREDLSRGYEYGRTVVPISEAEMTVTKLETIKSLEIVGFVPAQNVEHYKKMSRANIIVAQRLNDRAAMALSSLIHALAELENCAIARFVPADGKDPQMLLLIPSIEPDFECLIDCELPFAEDIRSYKFPALDRIITVSGKKLTEHRNLPSEELKDAMADFVDAMDISTFDKTDDGDPMEFLPTRQDPDDHDAYSPLLHRINHAVRQRAINPNTPVSPPSASLLRPRNPPPGLLDQASEPLSRVSQFANVKKVPPKALSRKRFRGARHEPPKSGLDVEALLSDRRRTSSKGTGPRISSDNAVPEFKQLMGAADDMDVVKDGIRQFAVIIKEWIRHSVGDSNYGRAVEGLRVLKEECLDMELPNEYNDVMRDLKGDILGERLGGDRKEMWWQARVNRLGLIEKGASKDSNVDGEEAKKFFSTAA